MNGFCNRESNFIIFGINLENIVCPDFEKTILAKGANFEEDSFYNVKFNCNEMQNRAITFYLKFENTTKLEKRVVFFDQFKKEDCPYQINDNIFKIKDESYPVNLALYYKDNKFDNFVYPRDISKKIILLDKAVITDVLDNDWLIDFNQSI